jgi:Skp family chaperone for outer membrane proteins
MNNARGRRRPTSQKKGLTAMLTRRSIALSILGLFALGITAPRAAAQDGPKIATVNIVKVFSEMQETKDLQQKMDAERVSLENELKKRGKDIEDLQQQRNLLQEGSEDFNKKNRELIEKTVSFQAWRELVNQDQLRQRKSQMKTLFERIEVATKEVAEQRKIDLVIVEHRPDFPPDMEKFNLDQIRGLINQRSVLYNNLKFDITAEVVSNLDAKYKKK